MRCRSTPKTRRAFASSPGKVNSTPLGGKCACRLAPLQRGYSVLPNYMTRCRCVITCRCRPRAEVAALARMCNAPDELIVRRYHINTEPVPRLVRDAAFAGGVNIHSSEKKLGMDSTDPSVAAQAAPGRPSVVVGRPTMVLSSAVLHLTGWNASAAGTAIIAGCRDRGRTCFALVRSSP